METVRTEEDVLPIWAVGAHDNRATDEELRAAIKRLHQNLGHCDKPDLLRLLRNGGATPRALELAREFRCSTCEEDKKPKVARPAKVPDFAVRPFTSISIDIKEVCGLTPEAPRRKVLNVICDHSSLQQAGWLKRGDGASIVSTLDQIWYTPCSQKCRKRKTSGVR